MADKRAGAEAASPSSRRKRRRGALAAASAAPAGLWGGAGATEAAAAPAAGEVPLDADDPEGKRRTGGKWTVVEDKHLRRGVEELGTYPTRCGVVPLNVQGVVLSFHSPSNTPLQCGFRPSRRRPQLENHFPQIPVRQAH